jgi:hypothetical protein
MPAPLTALRAALDAVTRETREAEETDGDRSNPAPGSDLIGSAG